MSIIPQRAFSRNSLSASIVYTKAENNKNEFHEAKVINCSSGGMFFVSDKELNPGDNIQIKLTNLASDPYWTESNEEYFAEVRWCQKNGNNGTASYAVGVRFIQESCKQCGNKILNYYIDEFGLCQDCRNQIDSMSDDNIKNCISNYLLGNVL